MLLLRRFSGYYGVPETCQVWGFKQNTPKSIGCVFGWRFSKKKKGEWYHYRVVVAFYLPGNFPVYAFSLLLGAGASLGLFWVQWQTAREKRRRIGLLGLGVLAGSLLGARLGYLLVSGAFYWQYPQEIARLPLGGVSWPGAVLGGLLAVVILGARCWTSISGLADALFPLIITLGTAVWLACWLDGCAYGPLSQGWGALPARDEWGNLDLRTPVQLMGAAFTVLLAWLLDRLRSARPWLQTSGRFASLSGLGLSVLWGWLSTLRADPAPLWRNQRLDTWAAVALVGLSVWALIATLRQETRAPAAPPSSPPETGEAGPS